MYLFFSNHRIIIKYKLLLEIILFSLSHIYGTNFTKHRLVIKDDNHIRNNPTPAKVIIKHIQTTHSQIVYIVVMPTEIFK